jgi:hypothetical protein
MAGRVASSSNVPRDAGRCLTQMLPAHPVLCSAESKRLFFVPACFPVIAARKR